MCVFLNFPVRHPSLTHLHICDPHPVGAVDSKQHSSVLAELPPCRVLCCNYISKKVVFWSLYYIFYTCS